MCGVVSSPFGTGKMAEFKDLKIPVAGKTGTTTDVRDLSFIGYTPYYAAGIWTGYGTVDEISPGNGIRPMLTVNQHFHLDIWRDVMEDIHKELGLPEQGFPFPITQDSTAFPTPVPTVTPSLNYVDTAKNFLKEIPPVIDQANEITIGLYKQYSTVPITKDQLKTFDIQSWVPVDEPDQAVREEKITDINDIVSEGIYVLVIGDDSNFLLLSNDCKTAWMETIALNRGYPRSMEYQIPDETAKNIKAIYDSVKFMAPDA